MSAKSLKVFNVITLLVSSISFGYCAVDCGSCKQIHAIFGEGRKIYQALDAYNELLASSGYLLEEDDVGFNLQYEVASFNEHSGLYDGANQALMGLAHVKDKCITNNDQNYCLADIQLFFRNVTQCIPLEERANVNPPTTCDPNYPYRSINGSCNNLDLPHTGEAFNAFERKVPPFYEDYILRIRESVDTGELPNPREIVLDVLANSSSCGGDTKGLNTLWLFFGQFLTHDVAFTKNMQSKLNKTSAIRCCSSDFTTKLPPQLQNSHACLPFDVPPNDAHYKSKCMDCLNYIRSERSFAPNGDLEAANQLNRATGYIDASALYGSTEEKSRLIRTFSGGELKTNKNNVLPELDTPFGNEVFLMADDRGNQTPQLALLAVLFNRLHNYIAKQFAPRFKNDDEKIYQETRRLVVALYQNIIFNEYVPTLINKKLLHSHKRTKYNPNSKGSVLNEFTTGPFRIFHVNTPTDLDLLKEDNELVGKMTLSEALFNTTILQEEDGFSRVLNGLLGQEIKMDGISTEIINKMFGDFDLVSMDIMRGRDHGLRTYADFRQYCDLSAIYTWEDLSTVIPDKFISTLKNIYKSVADVDLLVGLYLERKPCEIAGPTSQCLFTEQFNSFKDGDRFFFSHKDSPKPFNTLQLDVIRKFTLAKLICLVSERKEVQPNAFFMEGGANSKVKCSSLGGLNLSLWIN